MHKIKYITVSLPRTGTSSLTKMAMILGLSAKHAPVYESIAEKYNFISDTPCFSPSYIKTIIKKYDCKFIYIEREPKEWYISMLKNKLIAAHNLFIDSKFVPSSKGMEIDKTIYIDSLGSEPITLNNYEEVFLRHKKQVFDIIKPFPLLQYSFNQGWDTLCSFLNKKMPLDPIPHINKGRIFEPII